VRIKVQACGLCHSDAMTKEGLWPGITFPRVPGHEVVGVLDAVGKDVPGRWQAGQRVGVGWHAWHCLSCDNCRRGDFFACQSGAQVTGISFDGGYADYLVTPATALAREPAQLPAPGAAPLMCAGVTTFNALRDSGARPGALVAVLGLGGLGHLGVQYAARMGSAPPRSPGVRTRSRSPGRSARRTTSIKPVTKPPPPFVLDAGRGCLHRVSKNPGNLKTRLIAVVPHPRDAKEVATPKSKRE
jgi:D-arabinose 1-dehydrogenase-like Zn-dependent alcohol dehydrogenase